MGKRCRTAAWGATFALIVAACAATDAPSQSAVDAPRAPSSSPTRAPSQVVFPTALADASFVQPDQPDGPCAAGDNSRLVLFDSADGAEAWSFPIPRPGGISVIDGPTVMISFGWDRGQNPGIGAVDIESQRPLWQRFLPTEPKQISLHGENVIVVTRDDVRALDPTDGTDVWVNDSQFDFSSVIVGSEFAFAIDNVGVHAIDLDSGVEVWELEIERPDTLAANDSTLAVAAGPRLIAVDIAAKQRLWDISVNRLGAGQIWVSPGTVTVELSTAVAPGGGVVGLSRKAGKEKWRRVNIGEPAWVNSQLLVATTANREPQPAQPYMLFGLDASTGKELWRLPATIQASRSVIGANRGRVVTIDPHPAISGLHLIRLINATTGAIVWETASDSGADGAAVEERSLVSITESTNAIGTDRGRVGMLLGESESWFTTLPDGIAATPHLTPWGLVVISGEGAPVCVGRRVGEPTAQSAVLGASTEPE